MDEGAEAKRKLSLTAVQATGQTLTPKRMKSVEDKHADPVSLETLSVTLATAPSLQSMKSDTSKSDMSDIESDVICDTIETQNTVDMASQSLEYADDSAPTLEMASQGPEDESDMFDEEVCFQNEAEHQQRCQLLRRISDAIMGYDDVDGPSSFHEASDDYKVDNIVTYLQHQVDTITQGNIAKYLSSGSLEHVRLTFGNIHHFYHVATCLRLKQLSDHCLNFCFVNNQSDILKKFEGCGCQSDIRRESSTGYQRSQSVISNPDDGEPPQYYIAFTDNSTNENISSKDKRAVTVMVIDMSHRLNVFDKDVTKLKGFIGDGFACCSCDVKDSPYVFVSGGVGKGMATQLLKYDVLLGTWSKCAKMIHGRSQHMMVTDGKNSVFAISGHEVPCIEEYDINSNKWVDRVSLHAHVTSAAAIYFNNKIYIFGGKTPAGSMNMVQCYDVTNHTIDRLADLPCSFDGGKCVEFKGNLFIATDQGHMIRYNPLTGTSVLCAHQPVRRRQFGMFVKYDRIYLVGGVILSDDVTESATPQYRYNADKDTWVEKYKLCNSFPVLESCIINYPKKCAIIPFNEEF